MCRPDLRAEKQKMKRLKIFFAVCGCVMTMTPITALAASGTVIAANETQDEDISVEAMIDGASYLLTPSNEYRATFESNTDSPQIAARVMDDPYGLYECTWDEPVDLSSKNILTITVKHSANMEGPDTEEDTSDTVDPNSVDWDSINYGIPDTPAEEIDLSNGASDTGTLIINCTPVYAFKTLTLTLQDEQYKDYNITLHLDPYFFKARVKLPAGKYRETGTPQIEFQDNATTNGERYSWNRTGKTAFGGFITVPSGGEISVTDYEVVENHGNQTSGASSQKLLQRTQQLEEKDLLEKQDKEFYQKTYQDLTTETTAVQEPEKGFSVAGLLKTIAHYLPAVGGLAIAVIAVIAVVFLIIRLVAQYRENNRRH